MNSINASKTTWDLAPLFSSDSDSAIEKLRKQVEENYQAFVEKWQVGDHYLSDPKILKQALEDYDHLQKHYSLSGGENYYFFLRSAQNENDKNVKAKKAKAEEFYKKLENLVRFFELKLAKIPVDLQASFVENPLLEPYQHFLQRIFDQSRYVLSEPEEKILSLKSTAAFENWVAMTSGFLSRAERPIKNLNKEKVNLAELMNFVNSQQKNVRDEASVGINSILAEYADVAEAEINAILEDKRVNDELRGFRRPDASRHLADDIESSTVDALVKSASSNFSVAKDFYRLKAKLFGQEKLAYHERNVPYGNIDKEYSYSDGVEFVYKVMQKLDVDFADIFKNFVHTGAIDAYPAKGKHNGAFCAYGGITNPVYILLNYTNRLDDVRVLAHESGHGINDELMRKAQNSLNFGTSLATAEVASTFFEDFVLSELEADADDELKLALNMSRLNGDVSSIFRQIACYNFETELHTEFRRVGYLPKERIGEIFQKNMAAYMGLAVEQPESAKNWWVYWSHIRNYFYVYSYASGLIISKSLQAGVRQDPKFIEKVKIFLSTGRAANPKDTFLNIGIDIGRADFWNKGITEIETLLEATRSLAVRLGKINL